jgi:anti-anti-sigma factor
VVAITRLAQEADDLKASQKDGGSMLQLEIARSGDLTTVRCTGRIVFGDGIQHLRAATLSQDTRQVILDISSIDLVDAAGLGALVDLHQRLRCAGIELKLINPANFVSHLFAITRLDTVFHIVYPSAPVREQRATRETENKELLLILSPRPSPPTVSQRSPIPTSPS